MCQKVPNLEDQTSLPDVDAIRNFFLSKSLTLSGVNIQNDSEAKVTSLVMDQMCSMSGSGRSELLQFEEKSEPFSQNMVISDTSCNDLRMPSAAAASDPDRMIIQSINEDELRRHDVSFFILKLRLYFLLRYLMSSEFHLYWSKLLGSFFQKTDEYLSSSFSKLDELA